MTTQDVPQRNIRALEALVRQCGFGQTLSRQGKQRRSPAPIGIEWLDARLGGGLPRGAISEITGPCSSGRTGLVLAMLARSTREGGIAAYVDVTDCLDPRSAEQAGVALERLLWVRCGAEPETQLDRDARKLPPMEEAWQATNLVVSSGGFGVVAVDLGGLSMRQLGDWQRRTWARLRHATSDSQTALVLLAEKHLAGNASELVLELRRETTEWEGLLGEIGVSAEISRDKARGADRADGERAA